MGFNKKIACIGLSALMSISMVSYGDGCGNIAHHYDISSASDGLTPIAPEEALLPNDLVVSMQRFSQVLAKVKLHDSGMAQEVSNVQEDIDNGLNSYNNDFLHFADHAGNSPLYLASRNNPELVSLWYRISLLNALKGIKKDLDQLAQKGA